MISFYRAMHLAELWQHNLPEEIDKQTPMEQVIVCFYNELKACRLIELHDRVSSAEAEATKLREEMNKIREALSNE